MSEAEERSCITQCMIPINPDRGFIAEGDVFKSQKRDFEIERTALTRAWGVHEQAQQITLNYVRMIKDN